MAGHEVGVVDIDMERMGVLAEAQVADGDAAGLLGVVLEVRLTYMSVWSPMILMEFLLAPTVPSEPRPQNLQLMVPGGRGVGEDLRRSAGTGRSRHRRCRW